MLLASVVVLIAPTTAVFAQHCAGCGRLAGCGFQRWCKLLDAADVDDTSIGELFAADDANGERHVLRGLVAARGADDDFIVRINFFGGYGSFVVLNYDKLVSKGIELESIVRPHPDLAFNLGYTYVDAKVTDPLAGGDNGRQASNQPKHTITGAMTWTPEISSGVNGLFHADFRVNSDAFPLNDPLARRFTANDGFGIVNLRAGVNFGDGKYSIEGYVENLFDTYYNITAFPIPEQGNSFAVYPSPPRFYGVKVGAKF